jgi:hypothetical protein
VSATSLGEITRGEFAENADRKDFLPSEIGDAIRREPARSRVDFGDVADTFRQIVLHMEYSFRNPSSAYFTGYTWLRASNTRSIGFAVELAMQRMHSALERRQLALRIRRRQQHVRRVVVEIADPARHLCKSRTARRLTAWISTSCEKRSAPSVPMSVQTEATRAAFARISAQPSL